MDITEVLNNLVNSPHEIIELVVSYIPKPFLQVFLDFDPLVPYILPILFSKIRIKERYYNSSNRTKFFNYDEYNDHLVIHSMEELVQMVNQFGVFPKELEICGMDRSLNRQKLRRLGQFQQNSVEEEEEDRYQTDFITLVTEYRELLQKVELIHIPDTISYVTFRELMRFCNENQLVIGSVSSFSDEGNKFLEICPNSLRAIDLSHCEFTESDTFKRFFNLKTLKVEYADLSIFRNIPESIEKLVVSNLHTARGLNHYTAPILFKLRHLEVDIDSANEFSNVTSLFPNLELFHLKCSGVTNLDDLGLPVNIRTFLITRCFDLTNCLGLKKFSKLKVLNISQAPFPIGLFDSYDQFPVLNEFRYTPIISRHMHGVNLDEVKFPKTLEILDFPGNFHVETWEPPKNIRKLTLKETRFSNGINFQIPCNISELVIDSTNLTSLDRIRFPTGLRALVIRENNYLMSMINTNVQELTELERVLITLNPRLSKIDKFNRNLIRMIHITYNGV